MFSQILKQLRAERGISQLNLAGSLDVSPGNISDWECGKSLPSYHALVALTEYFAVDPRRLLGLEVLAAESDPVAAPAVVSSEGVAVCDGVPLTEVEADLVAIFRLLPDSQREELFDLACIKYERHVLGKKGDFLHNIFELD